MSAEPEAEEEGLYFGSRRYSPREREILQEVARRLRAGRFSFQHEVPSWICHEIERDLELPRGWASWAVAQLRYKLNHNWQQDQALDPDQPAPAAPLVDLVLPDPRFCPFCAPEETCDLCDQGQRGHAGPPSRQALIEAANLCLQAAWAAQDLADALLACARAPE